MNRNIKAEYDGKHFALTAEECNTVELLSFACDVVEQALHIVAGSDTELFDEARYVRYYIIQVIAHSQQRQARDWCKA